MARFTPALCALSCLVVFAGPSLLGQSPAADSPAVELRVQSMLALLSTADKIKLLGGTESFYTQAIPSINLPRLKMSDGPVGVRTWGKAVAYPASIGLAATWDTDLAYAVGESLGNDARARGVHFLLAPGVNIYRSPLNGRNMEYLGEDPLLSGKMATAYIRGVQSKGVSATVKHFSANNSEFDRHNSDSVVDERTLHEIYLPAFEMAVKEGEVGAVMDSYNLINGQHATQNKTLNLSILKGDWNFRGVLMSDWDSTYDGVAAANAGLDLEMPSAKFMNDKALTPALADKTVSAETLDGKVRRILRLAVRFGWLDRDQTDPTLSMNSAASAQVSLREAVESITLLKNEGNLLPLDLRKQHNFVVVGPAVQRSIIGGGGSSSVTPFHADSVASGMEEFAGKRGEVHVLAGLPEPVKMMAATTFKSCTAMTGADDKSLKPYAACNLHGWKEPEKYPGEFKRNNGARHTYIFRATYVPSKTGRYVLVAGRGWNETSSVALTGEILLEQAEDTHPSLLAHTVLSLKKGKPVVLEARYTTPANVPHFGMGLLAVDDLFTESEKKTISSADAVIVTVGLNTTSSENEAEGHDRDFGMPWGQDELVKLVASLNPHTIVHLQAGGALDVSPWIDHVPALVDSWYGGQSAGEALADVLFGTSPSGKLPFSWERTAEDNPTFTHYKELPGPDHRIPYSEGLFYGYRYYTSEGKKPLFPFGFGLTYTSFAMSGLKITPAEAGRMGATVEFDLRNTGKLAGAEVAQVYVGEPGATVARPVKELKAFKRVALEPGASQHVVLPLEERAFSHYDPAVHAWKTDRGRFHIVVGDSSADERLAGDVTF